MMAAVDAQQAFLRQVQGYLPGIDVTTVANQATTFLQRNIGTITGGVLSVGLGIIGGVGGAVVVIVKCLGQFWTTLTRRTSLQVGSSFQRPR